MSRVFAKVHLSACKYTKLFSDFCLVGLKSALSSLLYAFFSSLLLKFALTLLRFISSIWNHDWLTFPMPLFQLLARTRARPLQQFRSFFFHNLHRNPCNELSVSAICGFLPLLFVTFDHRGRVSANNLLFRTDFLRWEMCFFGFFFFGLVDKRGWLYSVYSQWWVKGWFM